MARASARCEGGNEVKHAEDCDAHDDDLDIADNQPRECHATPAHFAVRPTNNVACAMSQYHCDDAANDREDEPTHEADREAGDG